MFFYLIAKLTFNCAIIHNTFTLREDMSYYVLCVFLEAIPTALPQDNSKMSLCPDIREVIL